MFKKFSTELLIKIDQRFLQDVDAYMDDDDLMDFAIKLECELEKRGVPGYEFS